MLKKSFYVKWELFLLSSSYSSFSAQITFFNPSENTQNERKTNIFSFFFSPEKVLFHLKKNLFLNDQSFFSGKKLLRISCFISCHRFFFNYQPQNVSIFVSFPRLNVACVSVGRHRLNSNTSIDLIKDTNQHCREMDGKLFFIDIDVNCRFDAINSYHTSPINSKRFSFLFCLSDSRSVLLLLI